MNCVIAIEQKNQNYNDAYETVATGFLFGIKLDKKNENGEDLTRVFIATNRHVVQDKQLISVRFDHPSSVKRYDLPLLINGSTTWASHPNLIDGSIFNWIRRYKNPLCCRFTCTPA